ncbi:MAG TPA: thiol:disulfide interchange protein DsbA/DsbL [Steroidobacteraceae bacterium]|jgi:thiol:disulfide interchange protein DsbA
MKRYVALWLLAATLTACARQSGPPPSTGAPAPTGTAAPAPSAATVAAGANQAAASAASASDVSVAAKTQQEGADTGKSADSSEAALERVAALPPEGQLPSGKWVAGTNYKVLSPAQPTDAPPGKIEVIEMFWYGCPHCDDLDPYLESWKQNKAAYIQFVRVPVTWGEVHRAHARLFYTLQALGKLDQLHTKVFDEIIKQQDPLYLPADPKGTFGAQMRFAKANGISESDFTTAYNSFAVQNNLQKADDLVRRYRIDAVPEIVINGKYESDVGLVGSPDNLIHLINDLAASEKQR